MTTTIADLLATKEKLEADRAAARHMVDQYADGSRVEHISDEQYQTKLTALEKQISAARNRPVGPVYGTIISRNR